MEKEIVRKSGKIESNKGVETTPFGEDRGKNDRNIDRIDIDRLVEIDAKRSPLANRRHLDPSLTGARDR